MTQQQWLLGLAGDHELYISATTVTASRQHAERIRRELGLREADSSLAAYWALAPRVRQWQQIVNRLGMERLEVVRCVEVGSGLGLFTLLGRSLGIATVGIESSDARYLASLRIASALFNDNGLPPMFIQGVAEALPLPDHCTDVVTSFQTLEHVADVEQSLREIYRILKPGGLLFAQVPNYASFYEAHYGLLAPLSLGKARFHNYLGLHARPTDFLQHLQWLSPPQLRDILHTVGFTSITVERQRQPVTTSTSLPALAYPLPFRFKRGQVSERVARLLARAYDQLLSDYDRYPQLDIWALA